jgi:large subunit ribosomal protein L25
VSEVILNAKKRTVTRSKVKALRKAGILPAVMYGAGIDSTPLELDLRDATKIMGNVGASTLISLKVGNTTHQVLLREVQRDFIRGDILHVDFLKVSMDVAIRTEVPVELYGESVAVKEMGGLLVAGLSEIEVEALPGNLPDRFDVDLSAIESMDDVITVADLHVGEGIEVLTSSDEVLASVVYQVEEEIEEELEEVLEVEMEPELVERGKREEEEEQTEESE